MKYGELLKSWRDTLMSGEPTKTRLVRLREIEAELPRFAKGEVICNKVDTVRIVDIWRNSRQQHDYKYIVENALNGSIFPESKVWTTEKELTELAFFAKRTATSQDKFEANTLILRLQQLRTI